MERSLFSKGLVIMGLVAGCSGSSAGSPAANKSDAATPPDGGGEDAAPETDAGSGGGDGGSEAAVDAGPDQRIDPIALGHSWIYDVTVLGTYPACVAGTHAATVLNEKMLGGRDAFEVQSFCQNAGSFFYSVDGDRVFTYVGQGAWVLSLDAPVAAGHTWSNGLDSFTWEAVPTVTVPAGTYTSCWSAVEQVAYPTYTVFCRGIGPVHWHYEDGHGNGFDAVLRSKSF
jgi:hypothetical protein